MAGRKPALLSLEQYIPSLSIFYSMIRLRRLTPTRPSILPISALMDRFSRAALS